MAFDKSIVYAEGTSIILAYDEAVVYAGKNFFDSVVVHAFSIKANITGKLNTKIIQRKALKCLL